MDDWDTMTPDERKRMVGAIFEVITATADGIDRLEPCEEWRPYIVAAIPEKWVPIERKTGFEPATPSLARTCATAAPLPHLFRERCKSISPLPDAATLVPSGAPDGR